MSLTALHPVDIAYPPHAEAQPAAEAGWRRVAGREREWTIKGGELAGVAGRVAGRVAAAEEPRRA